MIQSIIEAILFTSAAPVTVQQLVEALGEDQANEAEVEEYLKTLQERWDTADSGVRLERVGGGWRCVTPPQLDAYLRSFHGIAARQRLSQAALEVLAIVAYRQPVTLPEINFIRGVASGGVVRTLLERGLIRVSGRKAVVGKPFLYRTTKEFLVHFGLESVADLPEPEDLDHRDPAAG